MNLMNVFAGKTKLFALFVFLIGVFETINAAQLSELLSLPAGVVTMVIGVAVYILRLLTNAPSPPILKA